MSMPAVPGLYALALCYQSYNTGLCNSVAHLATQDAPCVQSVDRKRRSMNADAPPRPCNVWRVGSGKTHLDAEAHSLSQTGSGEERQRLTNRLFVDVKSSFEQCSACVHTLRLPEYLAVSALRVDAYVSNEVLTRNPAGSRQESSAREGLLTN